MNAPWSKRGESASTSGRTEILKGIDLRVERGSVTCLIGPSGSGKTTFLRCINHLEKVDAGRLYVDDSWSATRERDNRLYELKERQIAQARRKTGMVFQRFNLFPHMTVLENIVEGPVRVLKRPRDEATRRSAHPAGPRRAGRPGCVLPARALGRPAAADRDRPGTGHEAEADAVRRTDLGARPGTRRRGARRHEIALPKRA